MGNTFLTRISDLSQYDQIVKQINWKDDNERNHNRWSENGVYSSLDKYSAAIFINGTQHKGTQHKLYIGQFKEILNNKKIVVFDNIREITCRNDNLLRINSFFPEKVPDLKANFQPRIHPKEINLDAITNAIENQEFISFYIIKIDKFIEGLSELKLNDRVVLINKEGRLENVRYFDGSNLSEFDKELNINIRVFNRTLEEIAKFNIDNTPIDKRDRSTNIRRINSIINSVDEKGYFKFSSFYTYHDTLFNNNLYRNWSVEVESHLPNTTNEVKSADKTQDDNNNNSHPKNIILYGPPGTGKTYSTKKKAVEIILSGKLENVDIDKKFNELKAEGRIEFVTFHQSYAYEQFVEGISVLTKDGNVVYEVKDGVIKRIGKTFEFLYQSLLSQLKEVGQIEISLKTSKFNIEVNMNSNIKVLTTENKNDNQVVLTKENIKQWYDGKYFDTNFKSYFDGVTNYLSDHKDFIMRNMDRESRKEFFKTQEDVVLIIDEINRGNISKIFGELITLIEDDKRLGEDNEIIVTLPYSSEDFGVPPNLYIIGTMNTADRSLVQLDTALRRRFDFEEMMPCYDENIWVKENENKTGYNLRKFLEMLNGKISNQYDREHQIGHSYLMKVKTIGDLQRAWENRIMPLLQEYFYANYGDLAKVIGGSSEYLSKTTDNGDDKWNLNMKAGENNVDGQSNFTIQFNKVYEFVRQPVKDSVKT